MSTRACPRLLLFAALSAPLVVACGSSSSGDSASFIVRTASNAIDATSEIVVAGGWMVYLGDEGTSGSGGAGSTDLNGDGDTADDVAVAVNLFSLVETPLRAAIGAAVVGDEIYLLVDESVDGAPPGMDWDGDGTPNDIVLLHWSAAADVVTYVDTIAPIVAGAPKALLPVAGERLYYNSSAALVGPDDTSLRFVDKDDPLVPVVVTNAAGGGQLQPFLIDEVEGLVFLFLDEAAPPPSPGDGGTDYNFDGDSSDRFVLALLDGTDEMATIANVELALPDADAPFDARAGTDTWLVGFLVSEVGQGLGGTNFNDPALFVNPPIPPVCAAMPDLDVDDDVLHFLDYATFLTGTPPVNTGLVGTDRVVVVDSYVATISLEADANCNLNQDADGGTGSDAVVRWVEAVDPVDAPNLPNQLRALSDVPGGSHGLSSLGDRFIIVVDEAADGNNIDGKPFNNTLVGFLTPADGFLADWTFAHPTTNPGTGIPGEPYVGANWLAPEEEDGRLGMVYQEEVPLQSINVDLFCDLVMKDIDANDSLPIWADFEFGPILDFDGQGYALLESDPGVTQARFFAFYRVSEMLDGDQDYNNDGDTNDVILFRNPQTQCGTVAMGTSSVLPPPNPAIITDGDRGGVFISDEALAGVDLNGDGDLSDLVPRYFLF